ncbi:MAG: gephyrin-like molybdotransferase Glp [Pseudomonadota bacterium]|nr:gephyrin-like molybdotransferase Glp [Pseudomonadota bacterium]
MTIEPSSRLAPMQDALDTLLEGVKALPEESVSCDVADGRVLARDVKAVLDVPPFDNSAMDGYALHHEDAGRRLPVALRMAAGSPTAKLERGTCARIFTGGVLPQGADCIVMQEKVERDGNIAIMPATIPAGDNVRRQGRDVTSGDTLLAAGTRLDAAALGHLAGQGIVEVAVHRRPRVALLSTGDEIIDPGKTLAPGQIYNSNRAMLLSLLQRFGAEVVLTRSVPDTAEGTRACLSEAAAMADLVVSTGGVSVGEEDHVKAALEQLGHLDLWRLAIRPGKPLALGQLPNATGHATRFVGLPGNPVSSYVGAWLFLRPLLGSMQGCQQMAELPRLWAQSDFSTSTGPRQHYMRVSLDFRQTGIAAKAFDDQNSGVLSSCINADALAVIPPHTEISPGDAVECLWLRTS